MWLMEDEPTQADKDDLGLNPVAHAMKAPHPGWQRTETSAGAGERAEATFDGRALVEQASTKRRLQQLKRTHPALRLSPVSQSAFPATARLLATN